MFALFYRRKKIETTAEHFLDVSAWPAERVALRLAEDRVHVAVNLNGYTRGSRNEIFALRPAPVQARRLDRMIRPKTCPLKPMHSIC
jgi:predicted O-linked N-acetylglucosamine transferase (SPINDLY family)